jgi:hypothetical protein
LKDDSNDTDEETYAETNDAEEDAYDEDTENEQNNELDKIMNDITNGNIQLPPLQLLIGQGTNQVRLPNIYEKMDKIVHVVRGDRLQTSGRWSMAR